jgi:hypothetical protein
MLAVCAENSKRVDGLVWVLGIGSGVDVVGTGWRLFLPRPRHSAGQPPNEAVEVLADPGGISLRRLLLEPLRDVAHASP